MSDPLEGINPKVEKREAARKKLELEERALPLYQKTFQLRERFQPWSIPEEYTNFIDALGQYTLQGPGASSTNAPHKWLEEYTHGDEMIRDDRDTIMRKLSYEKKSFLARLDHANTLSELDTLASELERLESTFEELDKKYPQTQEEST